MNEIVHQKVKGRCFPILVRLVEDILEMLFSLLLSFVQGEAVAHPIQVIWLLQLWNAGIHHHGE